MTPSSRALPLSGLELAAGIAIGANAAAARRLPRVERTPREALIDAIRPALERPPAVVSFSGGTDSSAVLAVATEAARRHGLADPVPVSLRFGGVASAAESEWQELVVGHLKLADWQRIELSGELDFLGERAQAGLGAHGLLWPANAHFHGPVFERAVGGSVLTGIDGDGLLGTWRWAHARSVLAGRRAFELRDALRIALALSPTPLRAARLAAQVHPHAVWLRGGAMRRLRLRLIGEFAGEPSRWDRRLDWYARRRYLRVGVHSLALLAAPHDALVVHPLLDERFLAALALQGGRAGYGGRGEALRALFGDLLPAELVGRRTKGEFGAAMWGEQARGFAADWDGSGVDPELVDANVLREVWAQPNPPLAAATVLQAAWLAGHGAG